MRKIMLFLLCVLLIFSSLTVTASAAQSTTYTYSVDRKDYLVRTQDAYLPDRTVTDLALKKPEDIFFGGNNDLYIADTGNRRVVVYNIDLNLVVREINYEGFKSPRGVYVTQDGDLYVADSAAKAVFMFGSDGNLKKTFSRPESAAFGDTAFEPYRIAVDLRGSLYIIGEGVYNGIIQLSGEGDFLGFFSSNKSTRTLVQFLGDIFLTDTQKAGLLDRLPMTFSNVFTDSRGIVFSSSMGESDYNVKKHNMAGANMFTEGIFSTYSITDITVDKNGIIYASDSTGYMLVYTPDGELIFLFGAEVTGEDIAGMYSSLMSLAVSNDGQLWALDNEKAFLQSYKPTEYTLSIYNALTLFNQGHYVEAGNQWNDVLRFNQMSALAHRGLGRSLLYRQEYDEAQLHFELSGSRFFYSQAFWETRNTWLMDNLYWIFITAVAVAVLFIALKLIDRKKTVKNFVTVIGRKITESKKLENILFAGMVARHPFDAYYYMKRKQRSSVPSAAFFFFLFFIAFMLNQVGKSFIIQMTAVEDMDIGIITIGFFAIIALFILCNYLVTSINDGEGSIIEIFKVISYSTLPATLTLLLTTLLSYVLTLNEIFLINMIVAVGVVWTVVLIYIGLQEMHNYNVKNNIKSLLITAAFILIITVILFNLTILGEQFTQFFEAITRELITNVQKTY